MDAIDALTQRVSVSVLSGPNITLEQEKTLIESALRAADHAWLRPSRYLIVKDDALNRLGNVFAETEAPDSPKRKRLRNMPLRAPLIIIAICSPIAHPKVPVHEQLLSTGAGVQNMLNAAWAMGLGAVWRTGDLASDPHVMSSLGLKAEDILVGFVYVGHITSATKAVPELNVSDFCGVWDGGH